MAGAGDKNKKVPLFRLSNNAMTNVFEFLDTPTLCHKLVVS